MVEDFSTPIAVLRETALAHNLAVMHEYCIGRGLGHAPHGKTTMSPELIARQLAHGAWGMTAATAWQARALITMGARRVMIANESSDRPGLRWIAERMRDDPSLEGYVFADSAAAVHELSAVAAAVEDARPFPVLVELGVTGGRAGVRTVAAAVEVGAAVAATPGWSWPVWRASRASSEPPVMRTRSRRYAASSPTSAWSRSSCRPGERSAPARR